MKILWYKVKKFNEKQFFEKISGLFTQSYCILNIFDFFNHNLN